MKALICELCNSNGLVKKDGFFVCEYCGTKYTVEEAKKMMTDEPVEIYGTVKVDTSSELENLYQLARRAKVDDNAESAARYYDMILIKDPMSWEAAFYVVYFKAMGCKIAQIQSAGISVSNCIDSVLKLIKDTVLDEEEQKKAYVEVALRVELIADMLYGAAKNHYDGTNPEIKDYYTQEWINNAYAAANCMYVLGDSIESFFGCAEEANEISVIAWKKGVEWHQSLIRKLQDKDGNRNIIYDYESKINKYDSTYILPKENAVGCYVATALYGSYDCPEVWTLRRYRDDTLAKTWYGRTFIKVYYAISPTLVKCFGHTEWFKKMWQSKLDRMVADLQSKGVESTPYEDKIW